MGLFSKDKEEEHEHKYVAYDTNVEYSTATRNAKFYAIRKNVEWVSCENGCGDNFKRVIGVERKELIDLEESEGEWEDVEWSRVIGAPNDVVINQ